MSTIDPGMPWIEDLGIDNLPVDLDLEFPEDDETEGIDPEDLAPAPEFAHFDVWCTSAEDWAAVWRPGPGGPWFCRNCGATTHLARDHEGDGA